MSAILNEMSFHFSSKLFRFNSFKFFIVFYSLISAATTQAQPEKWNNRKYFTVVSYNVENLFDTIKSPSTNDNDFTYDSKKKYNTEKYQQKLTNLSKVIRNINLNEFPEIIGLVEVENKAVLLDLVASAEIKNAHYQVILEEGPDPRGIDCGLLYRPDAFKYLSHKAFEVRFTESNRRTRDILYIKGMVNKDTLHVFVNHWSSRMKGKEASEPKRIQCAKVLKQKVDSLLHLNAYADIIIMGDFNDTPANLSLYQELGAGRFDETKPLINIMFKFYEQGKGSYYYNNKFEMLDNLIVTPKLTTKTKGLRLYENHGLIFNPEFICVTKKNGNKPPSKSYKGNKYLGGYSDHFPIYTVFYEK